MMKSPQPHTPPPSHDTEAVIAQHRETLKELFPLPQVQPPRKKKTPASITLVLALLAAGLVWLDPAYRSEQYATAIGQRQFIQLADGSELTLNTNTRLEVSWHLRSRRVNLPQGQAMFHVAKANFRPFVVIAANSETRVLGTRFDVYHEDQQAHKQVTVSVAEGTVRVTSKAADGLNGTTLTASQQVKIDGDGHMHAPIAIDPSISMSWMNGKLVFAQTPLQQVIAEIQRYRTAPIQLQGKTAQLKLSGTFAIDNTDKLLQLLPDILPVRLEPQPDGSLLISSR
ncbi:MAG: FecR domain-containing protein [Methylobacillus glycogenes]|nr:FecR domain-containing protein [Methylobacillus glycogenes]